MSNQNIRTIEVIDNDKRHFVRFLISGQISVMTEVFRKGKSILRRNTSTKRHEIIAKAQAILN